MNRKNRPEPGQSGRATRSGRRRLLYSAIALLAVLLSIPLLVPQFIDTASVKHKIQKTVSRRIGGQLEYGRLSFIFLPRPAIVLNEVSMSIPDRLHGTVAVLHIVPKLLPLLAGDLHLARIELDTPELDLELPAKEPSGTAPHPYDLETLQERLATFLKPLARVTPSLNLLIRDGQLDVRQGKQPLFEVAGLKLHMGLLVIDPRTAQANLQGKFATLTLHRAGRQETINNARLNSSVKLAQGAINLRLNQLSMMDPALELSGELDLAPGAPGISLNLSGQGIDVDATRRVALTLAGDLPSVANIFEYLRGGRVPQFELHSQGAAPAELADLQHLRIAGKLQEGAVSIPQLKLDLTDVAGDVDVADGILSGSGMSTRLEGSSGHDGSIKVALGEDSGLFQMELLLKADLAQAQAILKRIVKNPSFAVEIDKVTRLNGSGTGKLVLGDSLAHIKARLDVIDFNLSAEYQGVPFPIGISKGRLSFSENRVTLRDVQGSLGLSEFSAVTADIDWQQDVSLDLQSGQSVLALDELYPWLSSFDTAKEPLREVSNLSGQVDLASLHFHGIVDKPREWQFSASGAARELVLETPRFPAKVTLARGDFTYGDEALSVKGLLVSGLDAQLSIDGSIRSVPQELNRVELTLDGTLGAESLAWLHETLAVAGDYMLHAPLKMTGTKILWQPGAATSFAGALTVVDGTELSFDADYQPGQLNINQLAIKDQDSDASAVYRRDRDARLLDFSGTLVNSSLNRLFVDSPFDEGRLSGDISVSVPLADRIEVAAKGHLHGSGLSFPVPHGGRMQVEQFELAANGLQVDAEVNRLSWNDLTWDPLKASIDFDRDRSVIDIAEAKLCGIDSPGQLIITGDTLALTVTLQGRGLDVSTSYTCLTRGEVSMTGTLDFVSQVTGQGEFHELVGQLKGPLEMTFRKGVVGKDKALARLLEALNVTDIVKGRLPDLSANGFAYSKISIKGKFKNGKLIIEKLFMDGDTLDVLGHGELDIEKNTVNIELLASPFETVDAVIRHIPGVNYLLAGSLVAIPVSVKGELHDPKVKVLSASAVGSSLLGLAERTLEAPVKLIETILPEEKKE